MAAVHPPRRPAFSPRRTPTVLCALIDRCTSQKEKVWKTAHASGLSGIGRSPAPGTSIKNKGCGGAAIARAPSAGASRTVRGRARARLIARGATS